MKSNRESMPGKNCPDRMEHIIRNAERGDFESIMEIENACFPGELAYSRRQMRYLVFSANSTTLVEESAGQVTGYVAAIFRKNSGMAGIETIGVAPEQRGRGTGKRLLNAAENCMLTRGAALSRLEVSAGNREAISMYMKAGYQPTELIPDYYVHEHNGTRDAIRMEKHIGCRID